MMATVQKLVQTTCTVFRTLRTIKYFWFLTYLQLNNLKYGYIDCIVSLIYRFYTRINYWLRHHDEKNWNFHWIYLQYESKFQMFWSLKKFLRGGPGKCLLTAPSIPTSHEIPSDPLYFIFFIVNILKLISKQKKFPYYDVKHGMLTIDISHICIIVSHLSEHLLNWYVEVTCSGLWLIRFLFNIDLQGSAYHK